jgi:serine protease AprX
VPNTAASVASIVALAAVVSIGSPTSAQITLLQPAPPQVSPGWLVKLDPVLREKAGLFTGRSRVVIRVADGAALSLATALVQSAGGTIGRSLPIINGFAATVPHAVLSVVAASPLVQHLSFDRVAAGAMERTGATVGAAAIRQETGYDGAGIGVAIIDSGITSWHDDLAEPGAGVERVDRFVDFVNGGAAAYDDYGHGSHVAGIVAGNGADSSGARSGIAPAARIVALKVLDRSGAGRISDVIAALDYVVLHRQELNIRVVNLSVAAAVHESYNLDPLTIAARAAVQSGIVVVAAAGNNGRNPQGNTQYGGITAPGNAPWVLTVGASSHMGTIDRADDTIAAFSSRGPTAIDRAAKPDLVAPGVGIESLSDPASALYTTRAAYLLSGTTATSYLPYLSLSGTSMAAPVVAGTVALMLQANPALTPNAVKAILEYTAETKPGYNKLTQGAGFLNARGAVEVARSLASESGGDFPDSSSWSRHFIWGNRTAAGGRLAADASAWATGIVWGATGTALGQPVTWGVWSASDAGDTVVWGTGSDGDTVVWGTSDGDTVVWGTTDSGDTVVWGTSDAGDTVVWGTSDGDTVVWGTSDGDTVVWGTSCSDPSCDPVIWPHQ